MKKKEREKKKERKKMRNEINSVWTVCPAFFSLDHNNFVSFFSSLVCRFHQLAQIVSTTGSLITILSIAISVSLLLIHNCLSSSTDIVLNRLTSHLRTFQSTLSFSMKTRREFSAVTKRNFLNHVFLFPNSPSNIDNDVICNY